MTKRKKSNNDPHNTTQKTKDRATRTALTTGDELRCSGRVGTSYYTHAYHPQYYMREEMRKELFDFFIFVIALSVLRFKASLYPFSISNYFGPAIVLPMFILSLIL
jgi:hypothetical protein